MSKSVVFAAAIAAAGLLSGTAHAANLVNNPGFEADYVSGGSLSQIYPNPSQWTSSGDAGADNSNPNTGNMDGFLGGGGSLSQSITTSVGNSYTVSFYVAIDSGVYNDADPADIITAAFGSNSDAINGGTDIRFASPGAYFQDSFDVTATALSTILSFSVVDPTSDGNFFIDDISVTCDNCSTVTTPVPEAPSFWLFLPALFGMGLYGVRRGRSAL